MLAYWQPFSASSKQRLHDAVCRQPHYFFVLQLQVETNGSKQEHDVVILIFLFPSSRMRSSKATGRKGLSGSWDVITKHWNESERHSTESFVESYYFAILQFWRLIASWIFKETWVFVGHGLHLSPEKVHCKHGGNSWDLISWQWQIASRYWRSRETVCITAQTKTHFNGESFHTVGYASKQLSAGYNGLS